MHSIIRESFAELVSQDVPHGTGVTGLVKHILKQQTCIIIFLFYFILFYYINLLITLSLPEPNLEPINVVVTF